MFNDILLLHFYHILVNHRQACRGRLPCVWFALLRLTVRRLTPLSVR